jgi:exodeoxyribonuclease V alpha subunit
LADASKLALSHYAQLPVCATAQEALHYAKQLTILTAIHEGPSGCKAINADIARSLNPGFLPFFHGQLLLITENARHLGLANGDIAIVWRQVNQALMACFETDGQLQTIATSALPAFELAYALTIHKSQGSEYEDVTVVLPEHDNAVLSQALLYTAFTRAKRHLRIVASAESLRNGLMKANARVNGLQLLMQRSVE